MQILKTAKNSYRRNLSGTFKHSEMGCISESPKAVPALVWAVSPGLALTLLCLSLLQYPASTQHCTTRALGFTRHVAIPIFFICLQDHEPNSSICGQCSGQSTAPLWTWVPCMGSSFACGLSSPHLQRQRDKFLPAAVFISSVFAQTWTFTIEMQQHEYANNKSPSKSNLGRRQVPYLSSSVAS